MKNYKMLIKQWEDRKTRAVTKGEKQFIEKQILEIELKEKEIKKLKRLVAKAATLREKVSSWLEKDFYTCQIRDYNEQIKTKEES